MAQMLQPMKTKVLLSIKVVPTLVLWALAKVSKCKLREECENKLKKMRAMFLKKLWDEIQHIEEEKKLYYYEQETSNQNEMKTPNQDLLKNEL